MCGCVWVCVCVCVCVCVFFINIFGLVQAATGEISCSVAIEMGQRVVYIERIAEPLPALVCICQKNVARTYYLPTIASSTVLLKKGWFFLIAQCLITQFLSL